MSNDVYLADSNWFDDVESYIHNMDTLTSYSNSKKSFDEMTIDELSDLVDIAKDLVNCWRLLGMSLIDEGELKEYAKSEFGFELVEA